MNKFFAIMMPILPIMFILVGTTVALNNSLFKATQNASEITQQYQDEEKKLSEGTVNIRNANTTDLYVNTIDFNTIDINYTF